MTQIQLSDAQAVILAAACARDDGAVFPVTASLKGGAVGNVLDRLIFGYVVDFIDVYAGWEWCRMWFVDIFGTNRWPTFNVADIGLCVGATLLIIEVFIKREKEEEPGSEDPEDGESQGESA